MNRFHVTFLFLLLPFACFGQASSHAKNPCVACHAQGRSQPATSMAHASEPVQEATSLSQKSPLTFHSAEYSYQIEQRGDQSIYTVTDGKQTFEIPIGWAIGAGRIGQTYVFQKDGEFYEARVSFFSAINGLDTTIGDSNPNPKNLLDAAGRHMEATETARCFGCHMTDAAENGRLTLDKMKPGLQCVHCHTAAAKHLAGMAEGDLDLDEMKKLKALSTDETTNFCGQCHRTLEDVLFLKQPEIDTVRFQPYRLTLSKCYDLRDPRIGCLACHDPHEELKTETAYYDGKCLACHSGGKPGARPCRVSKKDCTDCHMPKIELPGGHHKFADHTIRIVKTETARPAGAF